MTNTVVVTEDKTLGEGDDGTVQCVEAEVTVTLPHESTWKFLKEDEFIIVSNSTSTITVTGGSSVTVMPHSSASITSEGASVTVKYEGDNTYLMWGNI